MNVRLGVPWIPAPTPMIRSDIYSELLAMNTPPAISGTHIEISVPYGEDGKNWKSKREEIMELMRQIGFNGLVSGPTVSIDRPANTVFVRCTIDGNI